MKITVLCENQVPLKRKLKGEWGLSLLIEGEKKILLDTGASDTFLQNAALLNKDLTNIDFIVISHGHWDHTDGLLHLKKKKLIVHPSAFSKRYVSERGYIGMPISEKEAKEQFELILSKDPYKLSENITFLGEIPRMNNFEANETKFYLDNKKYKKDFIFDDSALAIKTKKGLVIVTGCSHSGICNIIDYSKKVTKEKKIKAIIGGFHLTKEGKKVEKTIQYFKKNNIKEIYPLHCISLQALSRLYQEFKIKKLCAGDSIEI